MITLTHLLLCGCMFWLLGVIWTLLMMAEPNASRVRLFLGSFLWPVLTVITIVGVSVSVFISPFRKKPKQTQTEREASEREAQESNE